MSMGARIKERRGCLGLSQEDIARKLGVKREAVQQWESGKTQPRGKRLPKLADLLQCDVEWLFTGAGGEGERELINIFRDLSKRDQELIFAMVKALRACNRKQPAADQANEDHPPIPL